LKKSNDEKVSEIREEAGRGGFESLHTGKGGGGNMRGEKHQWRDRK
jgi:hypothetical protein